MTVERNTTILETELISRVNCASLRWTNTAMACLSTPLRFLPCLPSELQLATVLQSGQCFRWAKSSTPVATVPDRVVQVKQELDTKPYIKGTIPSEGEEFCMGWNDRTVCLRQAGSSQRLHSAWSDAARHDADSS